MWLRVSPLTIQTSLNSVVSNSWQTHGLYPARLLCPWGFPRQEYWSGLPSPPPGDFPDLGIEPKSPALQADSLSSEPPRGAPELRDGNFFQVAAFLLWNPVRLVKSFESKGPGTWSWPFQSSYFWKGSLSCYGSHCDHYSVLLLLPLAPALFPCLNVLLHFPLGLEGKHEYIYFQVSWKER